MWEVDLAETATAQSGAAVPEIMGERRNARRLNSDVSVFEGFDPMQSLRKKLYLPSPRGTWLVPRCDGKYKGRSHRRKSVSPAFMVLLQNPGLLTGNLLPMCSLLFCANGNACCSPVLSAYS